MAKYKLYKDPDYLYAEYVKKRRTAKEIADDNNVTEVTIWNHLRDNDLLKYKGKGRNLKR